LFFLQQANFAQNMDQFLIDGSSVYAHRIVKIKKSNPQLYSTLEPFAVSFYGSKAYKLAYFPITKLESLNLQISAITLTEMGLNSGSINRIVQKADKENYLAPETDIEQIKKDTFASYGMTLLTNASGSKNLDDPKFFKSMWYFNLGTSMGDLAAFLTVWHVIKPYKTQYPSVFKSIAKAATDIGEIATEAPQDMDPTLLNMLKDIGQIGRQMDFSDQQMLKLSEKVQLALMATLPADQSWKLGQLTEN
jgi:hypothetical protein